MKIKNTSTKIVHIGTTTILPDEVETVDDSLKNTPVVSMFIRRGDIQIVTGKAAGKAGKGGKKAASGDPDTEDTEKDGGKEDAGEGQKDGEEDKTDGQ